MGIRSNIVSRTIDFLRFPMAVMVVYIHNFTLFDIPYTIDWYHFDGMSIYNLIRVYVSLVLTHIAVPVFFLISGFLLFKGLEEWDWKVYYRKLRTRYRSLLIPYLTWIIIALAIGVSIKCLSLWHHHSDFSELYSWVEENVRLSSFWDIKEWNASRLNWLGYPVPASAPYLIPLWFIRDLLVMVIIAPLFYYLMRQSGGVFIVVLFLSYISLIWPYLPGFDIESVFYFVIGGYLSVNYDKLRKRVLSLSRFTSYIAAFAILLSLLLIYYYGHVTCFGNRLYPFFILSGVTSTFLLTKCMLERNACGKTESFFVLNKDKCFFIFAFHSIILSYIDALMYSLMPHNRFFYLVIFIMAPIIDVAICLFTYSLLRKSCQPILRVLSGGR